VNGLCDRGTRNIEASSLWYARDEVLLAESLLTAALMVRTAHAFFLIVGMRPAPTV